MSDESGSRDNEKDVAFGVIEVASLDERHERNDLIRVFGLSVLHRLAVDPARAEAGAWKRPVRVDRIAPGPEPERREEAREIGWTGLTDLLERCEVISEVLNQQEITEQAAIGVMLLLVHELEEAVLSRVLQIGSGSDYLVGVPGREGLVEVEVSGIRSGSAGEASSRLGKRTRDRLRGPGFVSVTTFQHGESGEAHSYLHFVDPAAGVDRGQGKGKRGRRS